MKRSQAIHHVVSELKVIKEDLLGGKPVNPLRFLTLSEIFKFGIEPKDKRFTAQCLDEASKTNDHKKHLKVVDEVLEDEEEDDNETEEEVNELLDYDGSIQSSKIPMGSENVKTLSSKKTTDDVVKGTRQAGTWTGSGHYFKRYYGESVEEIEENDMSEVLGYEETKDKNAEETIEYFEKEHEMDNEEASERAESMGKTEKLDKKGENYQRLTEKENLKKIAEDRARKMIEVILNNKSDDGEITQKSFLNTKIKNLLKLASIEGVSVDELIEKIKLQ
tara:strand:- start:3089 stop:3919 length:831 start_codon:yes stop_codon:yes gene_type:complete